MKARASLAAVLMAFVAFGLAACGGGDDDSSSSTTATAPTESQTGDAAASSGAAVRSAKVEIVDFAYDPDPVRVQAGGKVIWLNQDAEAHTATAEDGSFDTGTLEEGKLKSETFKRAGTYAYVCDFHPDMHGTVEVVEKD